MGFSHNDVFAVAQNGILHYDGTAWSRMGSGTSRNLTSIWGTSGKAVFVAGEEATFLQYDGSLWRSPERDPWTEGHFGDLWVNPKSDVFVVGDAGTVLLGLR